MVNEVFKYAECRNCDNKMPVYKSYKKKQFCSAKCRSICLPMPPRPDVTGNTPWNKGLNKNTDERLKKLSENRKNDKNPMWKGDKVNYSQLHKWVNKRLSKPANCPKCFKTRKLYLSNISYKYRRDLKDWEYLCQSCHILKDRSSGKWGVATEKFSELRVDK